VPKVRKKSENAKSGELLLIGAMGNESIYLDKKNPEWDILNVFLIREYKL
jgi:hypothetical protein